VPQFATFYELASFSSRVAPRLARHVVLPGSWRDAGSCPTINAALWPPASLRMTTLGAPFSLLRPICKLVGNGKESPPLSRRFGLTNYPKRFLRPSVRRCGGNQASPQFYRTLARPQRATASPLRMVSRPFQVEVRRSEPAVLVTATTPAGYEVFGQESLENPALVQRAGSSIRRALALKARSIALVVWIRAFGALRSLASMRSGDAASICLKKVEVELGTTATRSGTGEDRAGSYPARPAPPIRRPRRWYR